MRRFKAASIFGCTVLVGFTVAAPAMSDEPAQASPAASVSLTYTGEAWTVASGGLDQGSVYLDNIDLQAALDLERLFGWSSANAFVYALYANGNALAGRVGDLNGISNNETGEALRIVEAWIDQGFAQGRGSVRVGLHDLSSEFDAGEVRALFMNPAHGIGTDYSQSGVNGPSIWPVTSLALRVNYQFGDDIYLRGAIADGVPGNPDFPKRTTIDFEAGDGVLLAAEAGVAREGRLWSVGAWTYSEQVPDLATGENKTNAGAYVALEEALLTADGGSSFDLSGSLRLGVANGDVNPVETFFSATLVATGLLASRPEDQLGLGVIVVDAGSAYLAGLTDPADREINIELTYFAQVTEEIALQPDVQWVISPGADNSIEDALVFGLRLSVGKTWNVD